MINMENIDDLRGPHKKRRKVMIFSAAGLLLVGWLLYAPPGILGKADALGYAVCHRISERSFHIIERPMPLCARCSGMYLGALVGLIFQGMLSWRKASGPPWKLVPFFAFLFLAFALDGFNSFLHLMEINLFVYEPDNLYRLITGTGMGLVIAVAVFPAFNQSVWADAIPKPAVGSWAAFGGLLVVGAVIVLLILSENPIILYPLALASALTVLLLLTMIYSIVWVVLLRKENSYQKLRQMTIPIALGFTTALLQIFVFNLVRFMLTGTWDGFIIG
jgi:uncharacterized membrane protein